MTLIKAADRPAGGIVTFNIGSAAVAPLADEAMVPEVDDGLPIRSEADMARLRIAQLEQELATLRDDTEQAVVKAEQQGYDRGLEVASRLEDEKLAALGKSLEDGLQGALGVVEGETALAIEIAREALAHILGDPAQYQSAIVAIARHWAKQISASSIVRLRVSDKDFPVADNADPLALFGNQFEVVRDATLAQGACLFDLVLGRLDASVPRQLAEVNALFDRVAANTAVAA